MLRIRARWLCIASLLLALVSLGLAEPPQQDSSSAGSAASKDTAAGKKTKKKAAAVDLDTATKDVDKLFADASQFAGSDTCGACHDKLAAGFARSMHFTATAPTGVTLHTAGCESCHGPGKAHAESADPSKIINPSSISRAQSSAVCLRCHESGQEVSHFSTSQHMANGVGCVDCHSVHQPERREKSLKMQSTTLCYSCHIDIRPQFSRPFHHPVNEGLLSCADCHNTHGEPLGRELRSVAGQTTVCYKCHTEKAGPFAFEHAPVKTEGCSICHTPHGSSNPRLLRRAQMNLLCLECHTDIPSFHNQAQRYQACTLCHSAVHGSDTDRYLLKP